MFSGLGGLSSSPLPYIAHLSSVLLFSHYLTSVKWGDSKDCSLRLSPCPTHVRRHFFQERSVLSAPLLLRKRSAPAPKRSAPAPKTLRSRSENAPLPLQKRSAPAPKNRSAPAPITPLLLQKLSAPAPKKRSAPAPKTLRSRSKNAPLPLPKIAPLLLPSLRSRSKKRSAPAQKTLRSCSNRSAPAPKMLSLVQNRFHLFPQGNDALHRCSQIAQSVLRNVRILV